MTRYFSCIRCHKEFPGHYGRDSYFDSKECYHEFLREHHFRVSDIKKNFKPIFIREDDTPYPRRKIVSPPKEEPKNGIEHIKINDLQPAFLKLEEENSDLKKRLEELKLESENYKRISVLTSSFFLKWIEESTDAVPSILAYFNGGDASKSIPIKVPMYHKICQKCGKSFDTPYEDQIFCDKESCIKSYLPEKSVVIRPNGKLVVAK